MMKKIIVLFSFLIAFQTTFSQCNINTSICSGANAGPFTFTNKGPAVSTCLDWLTTTNAAYIILNISGSGNLNMLINGNSSSGFLDVAVFNIPSGQSPCTAIQSTSNQILCNYASSSSGCAQFGGQFSCPSNIGTVNVTAGQQLMIVVENWSGSSSSFTLQMSSAPGSAVAGLPDATITPVGNLCVSSAPVQLAAVSMGGTWSGTGVSPTGLFSPATAGVGAHTITYSVGIAPCNATSTAVINVVADPVVNLVSNAPVCEGETLTITTDTTVNGIYSWTGPNGFTSSQSAVLIPNVTTSHNGTYTLGIDMWGCSTSASLTFAVSPPVAIALTTPQPLCLNDNPATLSATVTLNGNTLPSNGIWSGAGVTDSINGVFNPTVAGVGTHTVTYTVSGFCGNLATADIVVKPHPSLGLFSNLTVGCEPLQTTATVSGSTGIDTLFIDFGNGTFGDSLGNYNLTYTNPICYDVKIWASSLSCTTDSLFTNFFCVQPNPVSEPDVVQGTATEYDPDFVFINSSTGATGYLWDFGDGKTSTLKDPKHTYKNEPGEYEVTLIATSDFGCKDTATITIKVIEDIVFYVPNTFTPDGDQFNNIFKPIMTSGFRADSYTLLIYNRWGELVFESHDPNYGWDGTFVGQMSPDGTYTWVISFKAKENSDSFRKFGHVTLIK